MLWNKAEEILNYGYCSSWSRRKTHDGATVTSLPSVVVDIAIEYVPINILLLWPYRRKCKSTVDEDTVRYA